MGLVMLKCVDVKILKCDAHEVGLLGGRAGKVSIKA